jgi:hypothetical protein
MRFAQEKKPVRRYEPLYTILRGIRLTARSQGIISH